MGVESIAKWRWLSSTLAACQCSRRSCFSGLCSRGVYVRENMSGQIIRLLKSLVSVHFMYLCTMFTDKGFFCVPWHAFVPRHPPDGRARHQKDPGSGYVAIYERKKER